MGIRCMVRCVLNSQCMLVGLLAIGERVPAHACLSEEWIGTLWRGMLGGRKYSMAQNFKAKLEESGPLPGSFPFSL